MYIVGKYICTSFRNRWKGDSFARFSSLYCVYPAISKSPKQLPNCLKIHETSVVLMDFIGVICEVSAYTVTISFCRSA